tara:strand:+ start:6145 stop:11028 length:4884 start_codon:yes stop_codon:yes gene_type:complete
MAEFRIDRIRYNWKGPWVASTAYIKDDIVSYGGKTFVSLISHTASADFNNDLDFLVAGESTPKWEQVADGKDWKGNWLPSTFYKVNDLIKYRGILYSCIDSHSSSASVALGLEADQNKWTPFAKGYNWLNLWAAFTEYKKNDTIRYNGIVYICLIDHQSASTIAGLEADQSKWTIMQRSDFWKNNWTVGSRYIKDDIVRYGGNVYRCTIGHTSNDQVAEGIGTELGLDSSVAKWELVHEGIEYKGEWTGSYHKTNDIVKYGSSLYKARRGMSGSDTFNPVDDWDLWIPGLGYETEWDAGVVYQPGDIATYGGYSYTSLTINIGVFPYENGVLQDVEDADWELLTRGYKMKGDWDITQTYPVGSVVRKGAYLYEAREVIISGDLVEPGDLISDPINDDENSQTFGLTKWLLLQTGIQWKGEWREYGGWQTVDDASDSTYLQYYPGDVVMDQSNTYICKTQHYSNIFEARPKFDTDAETGAFDYWKIYFGSSTPAATNALRYRGDVRTFNTNEDGSTIGPVNLSIGNAGHVIKVNNESTLKWESLNEVVKVYYVSTDGTDAVGFGSTAATPYASVNYACQYIRGDVAARAPATIFIATGAYTEVLPIVVPADTAIVGDELRSTTIFPATGYESSNMFLMHNGSGLRNMTLQGLSGTLGAPNDNLTSRPSAGAYVSLDPATGPDAEYAWITSKSPYVQNVTTFGTGCIGMKIDGALHNGGNKSMVANDFTQILSDGIGYWVNADGLSELVSVFTYYCHIGYLCTAGGKIRALNGNNSYGLYGSVAEGFNVEEVPATASVNNRSSQAIINNVYSDQNEVHGFGYTHCGQDYTNATVTLTSVGINADPTYTEFRQGGISEIFASEEDSNFIGGANYQYLLNKAQSGDAVKIILSGADTGTSALYEGMRIRISSGTGAGQYAKIQNFREDIKQVLCENETNGEPGWEHVTGMPIVTALDDSSYYVIEPRVIIPEPEFAAANQTAPSEQPWSAVAYGSSGGFVAVAKNTATGAISTDGMAWSPLTFPTSGQWEAIGSAGGKYVVVAEDGNKALYSQDGTTWASSTLPATLDWSDVEGDETGANWIAVGRTGDSTGTASIARSTSSGSSWNTITVSVTADWASVAYGGGTFVMIQGGGNKAMYSTNSGSTWTETALPSSQEWNRVVYGNDRFVAVCEKDDSSRCPTAVSYDGITWFAGSMETGKWRDLAYNQGLFVALHPLSDIVAYSRDGYSWTSKVSPDAKDWTGIAADNGVWVGVAEDSNEFLRIATGAKAEAIAIVASNRIQSFVISNPGSYYDSAFLPAITVFDPQSTLDVTTRASVNNGVLGWPTYTSRGTGYFSATATILGDGFAEQLQITDTLIMSSLTKMPGPGDNIAIAGIDGVTYYIVKLLSSSGTAPNIEAKFQISPGIGRQESPEHGTILTLREKYSQIRLTGHDFLDIGSGNFGDTAYPSLYLFGFNAVNEPQQYYEVLQFNGGRVFYTSTDQDGNFRVGELFEVEQSTGTISINASFFDLNGLDELSLGGVVLGGTGAVIREFSTDGTFTANSNNIVPTQKAIGIYVKSRISSGGSDVAVNRLNAGNISISGNKIFTPLNGAINFLVPVNIQGDPTEPGVAHGVQGDMLTNAFFAGGNGA